MLNGVETIEIPCSLHLFTTCSFEVKEPVKMINDGLTEISSSKSSLLSPPTITTSFSWIRFLASFPDIAAMWISPLITFKASFK